MEVLEDRDMDAGQRFEVLKDPKEDAEHLLEVLKDPKVDAEYRCEPFRRPRGAKNHRSEVLEDLCTDMSEAGRVRDWLRSLDFTGATARADPGRLIDVSLM